MAFLALATAWRVAGFRSASAYSSWMSAIAGSGGATGVTASAKDRRIRRTSSFVAAPAGSTSVYMVVGSPLHDGRHELVLVLEARVDRAFGETGPRLYRIEGRGGRALLEEQLVGGVENRLGDLLASRPLTGRTIWLDKSVTDHHDTASIESGGRERWRTTSSLVFGRGEWAAPR